MARILGTAFAAILCFLAAFATARVRYDNHKVVRVRQPSDSVRQWMMDQMDVYQQTWQHVDVRLTPEQFELFQSLNIDMEVVDEDVQKSIDIETNARLQMSALNATWLSDYHTYSEIKAWYQELASKNSRYATFIPSIGKSHEGRDIFAFRFGTAGKPSFYLQSLQHAREWITGAVVNYLVYHFLTVDTKYLSQFEFIVVPVVNPDGYEYSWTRDRLWRKNRRNNGGSYGVDLNRNWNSHWGQGGSSSSPSSDTYKGPSVASEPEVQAITKFFLQQPNIIGALDFHSYSQLLLRPYGWKSGDAEHETDLFACAEGMRKAILGVYGKRFDNLHSIELYLTTGTTGDWFYDDEVKKAFGHRIYAFTPELRPSGAVPGFQLPPSEITPSGEEFIPAIEFFVDYISANPITN